MKTKRSAASSQPERLIRKSEADILAYINSPKAKADAAHFREHVRKHGYEPSAADLKAIPLLTDDEFAGMYRPIKTPVTVRLDGDIVAWLKSKGGRYQKHMNATLRAAMVADLKR